MHEPVSKDQVTIGRLKKKIEKLKQQRDFHKAQHEHYAHVISVQPYLESRWKTYEEAKKSREEGKALAARCKEQAQLIAALNKELGR